MRLTKIHKQTYVMSILQDTPKINYETLLHDLIKQDIKAIVMKEFPSLKYEDMQKSKFFKHGYYSFYSYDLGIASVFLRPYWDDYEPSPDIEILISDLLLKARQQQESRHQLKEKLQSVVKGCNTLKQLANALPEFAAYLPTDEIKTYNTPALCSIVEDFKAAGWPKNKPESK